MPMDFVVVFGELDRSFLGRCCSPAVRMRDEKSLSANDVPAIPGQVYRWNGATTHSRVVLSMTTHVFHKGETGLLSCSSCGAMALVAQPGGFR